MVKKNVLGSARQKIQSDGDSKANSRYGSSGADVRIVLVQRLPKETLITEHLKQINVSLDRFAFLGVNSIDRRRAKSLLRLP